MDGARLGESLPLASSCLSLPDWHCQSVALNMGDRNWIHLHHILGTSLSLSTWVRLTRTGALTVELSGPRTASLDWTWMGGLADSLATQSILRHDSGCDAEDHLTMLVHRRGDAPGILARCVGHDLTQPRQLLRIA